MQTNAFNAGLALTAAGNASYQIKIFNITGDVVKSATSTQTAWQQNVSDLLPGTYVLKVVNSKDNTVVGSGTFIKI